MATGLRQHEGTGVSSHFARTFWSYVHAEMGMNFWFCVKVLVILLPPCERQIIHSILELPEIHVFHFCVVHPRRCLASLRGCYCRPSYETFPLLSAGGLLQVLQWLHRVVLRRQSAVLSYGIKRCSVFPRITIDFLNNVFWYPHPDSIAFSFTYSGHAQDFFSFNALRNSFSPISTMNCSCSSSRSSCA